jgi:hypothetical protein
MPASRSVVSAQCRFPQMFSWPLAGSPCLRSSPLFPRPLTFSQNVGENRVGLTNSALFSIIYFSGYPSEP